MKLPENQSREYRLIAIAVVFFAVGLFFYFHDGQTGSTGQTVRTGQINALPSVVPASGVGTPTGNAAIQPTGAGLIPSLAKFPAPAKFQAFRSDASGLNGQPKLTITTTCHDAYVTILIFAAKFDYRADVSKAVYNKAFACTPKKTFQQVLSKADMANVPFGTYYVIVADQGRSGAWYNPR